MSKFRKLSLFSGLFLTAFLGASLSTNSSVVGIDDCCHEHVAVKTTEHNASATTLADHTEHSNATSVGSVGFNLTTLSSGTYVLSDDVTLTSQITITTYSDTDTVTICLNGHTLSGSGSFRLFMITKGNLTICDTEGGQITGGYATSSSYSYGGGAFFVNGGSLTIDNGTITGNSSDLGGGAIYVISGSSVTLNGGTISSNNSTYGGAVYLNSESSSATFIMNGGTISGNYTTTGGGGAFWLNANDTSASTFTMYDGTISGNYANGYGGAIRTSGAYNITIDSGTISSNYVARNSTDSSDPTRGGAIYLGGSVNGASFTLNGGSISSNYASISASSAIHAQGGGIFADGVNNLYLNGGTISSNLANRSSAGTGYGAGIYATNSNSTELNIYLDGTTISSNRLTSATDYYSCDIEDARGAGLCIIGNVNVEMTDGSITGNFNGSYLYNAYTSSYTGSTYGAGVYLSSSSSYSPTFTMDGGSITDNYSSSGTVSLYHYGAGVYVESGYFTLNGGTISGNRIGSSRNTSSYNFHSQVSWTMNGGYLEDAYSTTGTIYGGYLSTTGYSNLSSTIDSSRVAINISSYGTDLDSNYDADFPVGIYIPITLQLEPVEVTEVFCEDTDISGYLNVTYYGDELNIVTSSYEYSTDGGSTYTDGLPTEAGQYVVRATIPHSVYDEVNYIYSASFTYDITIVEHNIVEQEGYYVCTNDDTVCDYVPTLIETDPEPDPASGSTTYIVVYTPSSQYTVSGIADSYEANDTVSFTVTVTNDEKELDQVAWNNNVLTASSTGTYSFTMPESDVVITISLTDATVAQPVTEPTEQEANSNTALIATIIAFVVVLLLIILIFTILLVRKNKQIKVVTTTSSANVPAVRKQADVPAKRGADVPAKRNSDSQAKKDK